MLIRSAFCGLTLICLILSAAHAQSQDPAIDKETSFPSRLLGKLQSRTAHLNQQLTTQTEKYLQKMQRREERLQKKLYAVDSNAAKQLFAGSSGQYTALMTRMKTDTGHGTMPLNGTYLPYVDSLQGAFGFLQKNPGLLGGPGGIPAPGGKLGQAGNRTATEKLGPAVSQFQTLQTKMQDADQVKAYVQQRKQIISQYISQHANLQNVLVKTMLDSTRMFTIIPNSCDSIKRCGITRISWNKRPLPS